MRLAIPLSAVVVCLCFACTTKETIYETEPTNVIIDDNTPPPYEQVTTVQIQNYINKVYIDLLGREPLDSELADDTELLKSNNLSDAARESLLTELMQESNYYARLYEIYTGAYLNGADDVDITERLQTYIFLEQQAQQQGDYLTAQVLQFEISRLTDLQAAIGDYEDGEIDISEFMSRICNNDIYEEINMGSENFVLACFENFLKRFPTETELAAGITMVDGFSAQLLLKDGTSKLDFLRIITTTPEFFEGLAVDVYQQLLARLPDSEEMTDATLMLGDDRDYQALQRVILKSEEYAGF